MNALNWSPQSWRSRPIQQVPDYPDQDALAAVEGQLRKLPPLIYAGEARSLKAQLARVAERKAFLMQGG
ncbi:3-deoxy-7-phosphoheptulonate synthase, partial [Enterococcus faecium]|uniref:3-deoxy-7-phosphoheptulonate synthase n=1 Tax=Enterococcus faecium TaxID=1352 RepID=UPI003AAA318A